MVTIEELKNLESGRFIGIANHGCYYKVIRKAKNGLWLTNRFYLGHTPTGKWLFKFSLIKDNCTYWIIVPKNSREARDLKASAKY